MERNNIEILGTGFIQEALKKAKNVDGVLLDIRLRNEDRFQFLSKAKEKNIIKLTVVVSSYLDNKKLMRHAMEMGAVGCIEKGCSASEFTRQVSEYFDKEISNKNTSQIIKSKKDDIDLFLSAWEKDKHYLEKDIRIRIDREISQIRKALEGSSNVEIVAESLRSIRNISEGITGSLAASGILSIINQLFVL